MTDPEESPAQIARREQQTRERLAKHDRHFGLDNRTEEQIARNLGIPYLRQRPAFTAGDDASRDD